jgi:hypothetical protein
MRSLPRIASTIPNDLRNFLDKVREYITNGDENRFVTVKELRAGGVVGTTPSGSLTLPTVYTVDEPGVPTGLAAAGALDNIIVTWNAPNYNGHSYTEVWAAATNDFSAKALVGMSAGVTFTHAIGSSATRYYWIRFVNTENLAGPYNSTVGVMGQTGTDPEYYINVLSDEYGVTGPAPFFHLDSPTVINGVTIPAGTYIKEAWIADATIGNAKIRNLAVDTAKIANLSVTSLKLDDLAVTNAKIAALAVDSAKIAALAVTEAKIADLAVTNAKIANLAVESAKIADLAVTNAKIAALAVDSAKIADLAVTNAKIAALAVDSAKIADLAVTNAKIGALAVDSAKIASLAVTEAKIGNLAVTTAKIGDFAVSAATFVNGATVTFTPPSNSSILAICRGFASETAQDNQSTISYIRIRKNGNVYDDAQAPVCVSYPDPNGGWARVWADMVVAFQDTGTGAQISYNATNFNNQGFLPYDAFQWAVFILKK